MNKKKTPNNQQEMTFGPANTAGSNANNTPTSTQQDNNQTAYTDDNIRHLSDRSKSSKDWRQCENALVCTSADLVMEHKPKTAYTYC